MSVRTIDILAVLLLAESHVAVATAADLRTIDEHRAVDPQGTVEIVNVEGSVSVIAWERPEIEVSGTIGPRVEKVDIESAGTHAGVRVVLPGGFHGGSGGEARLTIHVPQQSAVEASLVSADYSVTGLRGAQRLHSVSGRIEGDAAGSLQLNAVSGAVRLKLSGGKDADVTTVSGDIMLSGAGGEVAIHTVSGDTQLKLEALTKARIGSVSGRLNIAATLAPAGQLDVETVSGDAELQFTQPPGAEIDVQSLSGDIDNCFGPQPTRAQYGPGRRLSFRNGDGAGRVHLDTKSGNIKLCVQGTH
jgi:DUF4097 and DUF4098 domain-containing protein YvlB